jgi:hypothetical protein
MKRMPPLLLCASFALLLAPTRSRAQDMTDLELGDEVHYPWTLSGLGGGFSAGSVGDQESRVLTIPVSIWLRRLSEDRKMGLRLRFTGVIGYQDFERLEEFNVESIRLGGIFPGLEVMLPLGDRSMLRPFADIGIGLSNSEIKELLLTTFGLRTEFVFPWKRWELGLEPRAQMGVSWASTELVDDEYLMLTAKMDARYPLGFQIGGSTPDVGVYFEPGYFPNGLDFTTPGGTTGSIGVQYEAGVTVGFRDEAPKIWFIRVPRLGVGYRFGDGLTGLRIKIGGDRVTRLPLPQRDH